jgi:hypothetical protein
LLEVRDARSGVLRRRLAVGVAPQAVAVDTGNGRVVVANGGGVVASAVQGWGVVWLGRLRVWLPWLDRLAPPTPAIVRVTGSVSVIDAPA